MKWLDVINCEVMLLREIAQEGNRRRHIAGYYRMALLSSESPTVDWVKVNQAIIDRWSVSGLKWIYRRAQR